MAEQKPNQTSQAIAGLVLLVGGWFAYDWFVGTKSASDLSDIHNQVATDAVEQYNIAARQGDPVQKCVQAGLVAAAFLQAKDEPNFRKWKETEQRDCTAAGAR